MPALSGPQYLGEGLKLIMRPGLRLFVLIPLTLNLLVFALLIGFAMQQFSHWVDLLMPSLPDWLSFLQYIVWPLFVLLVLVIVFFTFTMVANIISAPFNGFLSEKVEVVVRGACMGFGGVTYLALLIPLVNLVMMPAAVAGATLFWVREEGEKALVK